VGQALYRKYRSKSLSEIIGQEHITKTLERAIKAGKISHAYLFTGPKGVGKTSIARILAHEVNGLPYTDESIHLDIIEIDAASNRRIDEIRDLRDKVHIAPTSAKYKVYIIDEVHMLTKEAFNALLKTLEEPPAHVIFILATTEAHKLPDTIVSRTQRFTFKAITQDKAVGHLKELAEKEGMKINDDALELLAEHGGGSFRDAIGLLDQIGNSKKSIARVDVEQMIGIAPKEAIAGLLQALEGSPKDIITSLDGFVDRGIASAQIAKQFAATIRNQLLDNTLKLDNKAATSLLAALLAVPASPNPGAALELALFEVVIADSPQEELKPILKQEIKLNNEVEPIKKEAVKQLPTPEAKVTAAQPAVAEPAIIIPSEDISSWWPQLVEAIKKHNNTLYGVLRMAHPTFSNNVLSLGFAFGFHAKKISDTQTAAKLQDEIKILTGQDVSVKATHNKDLKGVTPSVSHIAVAAIVNKVSEISSHAPDLGAVTSIFGGGEVLES
jgi:DNA polymerase III subunit gamma/tau